MDSLLFAQICKREQQLQQFLPEINQTLRTSPEGSLRAYRHGKSYQYALYPKSGEHASDKKRIYIKKEKLPLAVALANKEYCTRAKSLIQAEQIHLQQLKEFYQQGSLEQVYESFPKSKQQLITPLIETDQQFLERWQSEPYHHKTISPDLPVLKTERGEQVRSKSEVLIANLLTHLQIPYRYECALDLHNSFLIHPDFTILDLRRRREIYFEHFGMMDDPNYATKAIERIALYEQHDIFPGDRLLMTFETKRNSIDLFLLEQMLMHHLS